MTLIEEARERLGAAPRQFSWWDKHTYLRVKMPDWAAADALRVCFTELPSLLERGRVTWGYVVQANSLLFEPGRLDCPGAVVYAMPSGGDVPRTVLADLARRLFALKNTQPSESAVRAIADQLTDEMARPMGVAVPREMAGSGDCRMTSIFFPRKHLPNRTLSLSHFPILVAEDGHGPAAVVPSAYWPRELVDEWTRAEDRRRAKASEAGRSEGAAR